MGSRVLLEWQEIQDAVPSTPSTPSTPSIPSCPSAPGGPGMGSLVQDKKNMPDAANIRNTRSLGVFIQLRLIGLLGVLIIGFANTTIRDYNINPKYM